MGVGPANPRAYAGLPTRSYETVLFRFSEAQQLSLQAAPEAKAVVHMPNAPRRDVFRFPNGREVSLHALPDDVIFDVLEVPGREDLSAVLKGNHTEIEISETATGRKSMLETRMAALLARPRC
jgi:hypothetical protein